MSTSICLDLRIRSRASSSLAAAGKTCQWLLEQANETKNVEPSKVAGSSGVIFSSFTVGSLPSAMGSWRVEMYLMAQ